MSHVPESDDRAFHDMMHKEMEIYVDDMIAKSENEEDIL